MFGALEDCDGALAGAGEFEFSIWVQAKVGFDPGTLLSAHGDRFFPIQLSDGESIGLVERAVYRVRTGGTLSISVFVTEWDVLGADSRMDDALEIFHLPFGDYEPNRYTIVVGGPGCKVQVVVDVF